MHDKPIYFAGKKFSDLFEAVDAHHNRRGGFRYMHTSGDSEHRGFAVKPRPELEQFIRDSMLSIVDDPSIYFVCTFRTDGTVLISAQYNLIIGSRWLTITTPDDIPTKNQIEATRIVEDAQKWADQRKAEGWTKADFANEMKSFLNGGK